MLKNTKTPRNRLKLEALEDRLALSVTNPFVRSDGWLMLQGDHNGSLVTLELEGSQVVVRDFTNELVRGFDASSLRGVHFEGGDSWDIVLNNVHTTWLPMRAYGRGGDDFFLGAAYAWNDLDGGAGDDTLKGGEGVDTLIGGSGSDILYGYGHSDCLFGQEGLDYLFGGAGFDYLNGGVADGYSDHLYGQAGPDIFAYDGFFWNSDEPRDFNHWEGDGIENPWSWWGW